jgi:hypothetical protein
MTRTQALVGIGLAAVLWLDSAVRASAHHSLAAEFDVSRMVTISGTVTKMEWKNPHSWLYVDVKDAQGRVVSWAIEFGAPNALYRRGWRRDDLPPNLQVTVTGYPALDKSNTINATDVKLPDGRTLFTGNAPGSNP